jgi:hypothetical protein
MLVKRGIKQIPKERYLYVSKPLLINFFLVLIFLSLIFLLSFNAGPTKTSSLFKNKELFSDLDKAKEIFFTIKLRENLDRGSVHRLYFRVEVPKETDDKSLMAVAQRIVRETISREYCHGIRIDFGRYGYVDFAPYGEWEKAGEIAYPRYERYRFKSVLNPLLSLNKK